MTQLNYPHAPDGCQPGERVVFNALDRYLPDDYFVWFEPTLFGRRHSARPDFLLLGRDLGVIVIEVKDWSLDRILSATRDTVELITGSGLDTRTNPEKQAQQQFKTVFDEIYRYRRTATAKYRLLLQSDGPHRGKPAFPVSYLIAFPFISRAEWQGSNLSDVINEARVLLKDDLQTLLPKRLRRTPVFCPNLNRSQLDTLKWMLYPEIRIPYRQAELITLNADQAGLTRLDTYLPPEGQLLARNTRAKLVRGVVGSGKTLILLNRAKFISEQNPNWRVLVLTYNKSLREYLRQIFEQIGGDPARVQIIHFHKWCYDLLAEHDLFRQPTDHNSQVGLINNLLQETGISGFEPQFLVDEFNWIKERVDYHRWGDYPDSQKVKRTGRGHGLGSADAARRQQIYDLFKLYQERLDRQNLSDWAEVPLMVLRAMDDGLIERGQYHAVLIDEAQDFAPSWFRVAFRMIKPETGMVFIVGDGAQKIYSRDFTWKELGMGINAKNSYVMNRSYRSTREIIDVALETIRDSQSLLTDLEAAGDSLVEPEHEHNEHRHGPLPVLLSFETPEKEYAGIAGEIKSLLQRGYRPNNIVILQRHRNSNEQLARDLRRNGLATTIVKGNFNAANSEAIRLCTLHSAKGLEFEVVFICGLEQFQVSQPVETNSPVFQELLDQERKLLYVGMTRARQLLYISYSGVPPNWIIERLRRKLTALRPTI